MVPQAGDNDYCTERAGGLGGKSTPLQISDVATGLFILRQPFHRLSILVPFRYLHHIYSYFVLEHCNINQYGLCLSFGSGAGQNTESRKGEHQIFASFALRSPDYGKFLFFIIKTSLVISTIYFHLNDRAALCVLILFVQLGHVQIR